MTTRELEEFAQKTILMALLRRDVCQLAGERAWTPAMKSYRRAFQRVVEQAVGVELQRTKEQAAKSKEASDE